MASDYSRLLKQDFSDMKAAAASWQKVAAQMDTAYDRHRTKASGPLHSSWDGDDGKAALRFMEDIESRLNVVRTEAMSISSVIETTRFWMEQAQTDLRSAVKAAEAEQFTVDGSGKVVRTSPCETDADLEQANVDRHEHFQERVDQALKDARKASDDGKKALSELNGDIMDRRNATSMSAEAGSDAREAMKAIGVTQGPQVPEDPKEAAKWWQALDEKERLEYATLYPEQIGKADGLPTDVRDNANRLLLEQELSFAAGSDQSIDQMAQEKKNLQSLKDTLDKRDGATGNKQLYLLDFDGFEDGKAVIAMGNPDKADNVGVQVPGTATDMTSTEGQLGRIDKLQRSAERADPSASTSMVYWLGYDAPEVPSTDAANLAVAGTGRADDAAPHLRDFTHGLRASHEGDKPANLTVMGHSYGSTVVGAAAAGDGGLAADNIAVVGSPGLTVSNADKLNIDPDHVYVGRADDDPIHWAAGATLGADPTKQPFGGQQFKVDTHGHSGYWDESDQHVPSESLANQGRIIAGQRPTEAPPKPPAGDPDRPDIPMGPHP